MRLARRALSTMPRRIDPYAVLGVERGCNAADLKAAYLKRAMQYHPDTASNPEDRESAGVKFKEIAEAYNLLREGVSWSARRSASVSRESAEELFWRLYGVNGEALGGPSTGWQRYAKLVDCMEDTHVLSGAEARSLYRDCLRELRGVEADVVASVRDAAREKLRESSGEASAERIRDLLIDGRHQLDTLRSCLGTAVVKPDWALRPGVHVTPSQLEQARRSSPLGLAATHACSLEQKEEKERSWAAFVETKLRPTFEACEEIRLARAATTVAMEGDGRGGGDEDQMVHKIA